MGSNKHHICEIFVYLTFKLHSTDFTYSTPDTVVHLTQQCTGHSSALDTTVHQTQRATNTAVHLTQQCTGHSVHLTQQFTGHSSAPDTACT
jgi:hypothetical protein